MVSTGAFARAIFAIVYIAFEGLFFYSKDTKWLDFGKAALTGIPFLVYVGFYFSAFWKDDACIPEGDITVLFAIAFAFSGVAVVAFLLKYLLTSIHALLYSSMCIAALAFQTNENLCGLKPEFQVFSVICCALAAVFFFKFSMNTFPDVSLDFKGLLSGVRGFP